MHNGNLDRQMDGGCIVRVAATYFYTNTLCKSIRVGCKIFRVQNCSLNLKVMNITKNFFQNICL